MNATAVVDNNASEATTTDDLLVLLDYLSQQYEIVMSDAFKSIFLSHIRTGTPVKKAFSPGGIGRVTLPRRKKPSGQLVLEQENYTDGDTLDIYRKSVSQADGHIFDPEWLVNYILMLAKRQQEILEVVKDLEATNKFRDARTKLENFLDNRVISGDNCIFFVSTGKQPEPDVIVVMIGCWPTSASPVGSLYLTAYGRDLFNYRWAPGTRICYRKM